MAYNYEYPYTDPGLYNDDWLINKVKQLAAEWEDMKVKFTTLEEYVKNYFANLNLQDEVNQKIDAMFADGSLYTGIINKLPIWKSYGSVLVVGNSRNAGVFFDSTPIYSCLGYILSSSGANILDFLYGDYHIYNGSMTRAIQSFCDSHPGVRARYIVFMLSPIDLKQDKSVIDSELVVLSNIVYRLLGAASLLVPAPVPTTNCTIDDVANYNKTLNISASSVHLLEFPFPAYLGGESNPITDSDYNVSVAGAREWGLFLAQNYNDYDSIATRIYTNPEKVLDVYAIQLKNTRCTLLQIRIINHESQLSGGFSLSMILLNGFVYFTCSDGNVYTAKLSNGVLTFNSTIPERVTGIAYFTLFQ